MSIKQMFAYAIVFAVLLVVVACAYIKDSRNRKLDALEDRLDRVESDILFNEEWVIVGDFVTASERRALRDWKSEKQALQIEIKKMEAKLK